MTRARYSTLSEEQAQHFLDKGYVVIKGCLSRDVAAKWSSYAFERLGCDPEDPATWREEIVWMNREHVARVESLAPRAWGAICDVVGGEDRIDDRVMQIESKHFTTINSFEWSDAFIVNFRRGADEVWVPPSAAAGGWHKDGSFFRHFLDSREQALLTVVYWSDVAHKGGGTFIAPDSIKHVARFLRDHPEGVEPGGFGHLIESCSEFVELTGEAGDFIILHPFMLHASSNNHSGRVRVMSNPPIVLKEPLNLNRSDPETFSLLERATLQALGLKRFDFKPAAPRDERWTVFGG
ncbi:MAG: phytanoyl-CoA dioxygenase family protein [Trueperaceae bacterium]|nr:MAG: phytanoyl-CoA dioxygenase family protein [Trueperaceae bacterium]